MTQGGGGSPCLVHGIVLGPTAVPQDTSALREGGGEAWTGPEQPGRQPVTPPGHFLPPPPTGCGLPPQRSASEPSEPRSGVKARQGFHLVPPENSVRKVTSGRTQKCPRGPARTPGGPLTPRHWGVQRSLRRVCARIHPRLLGGPGCPRSLEFAGVLALGPRGGCPSSAGLKVTAAAETPPGPGASAPGVRDTALPAGSRSYARVAPPAGPGSRAGLGGLPTNR